MSDVKVKVLKRGPLVITGEFQLVDADEQPIPHGPKASLCRCGASSRKPFCDGTHSKIGFDAAEQAVPESKE